MIGGMFGAKKPFQFDPVQMPDVLATGGALAAPEPRTPSFFGEGGTGRAIAGHIGDALLQMNRMDPIYAPAMAGRQKLAQQQAQAQAQQQAERNEWLFRENWKLANPSPTTNDTIADYNFRKERLGQQAADDWLRSANDPIVNVTLPGNRFYSGPRSGLATALGGAAASRPEIGSVVPDPRKTGGAGQGGSRTFPY